jgi:hypothetical protein
MAKFLKVALWNANGVLQHEDEIKIFLDHKAIDILLVSATHFTDSTFFIITSHKSILHLTAIYPIGRFLVLITVRD